MGKLAPLVQNKGKSIPDISRKEIGDKHHGTMQSQAIAKTEIANVADEIISRLKKW